MSALPPDTVAAAAEEAALEQVARTGVQLVDLQFSDLTGGAKSLTVPAGLLAQALADAIPGAQLLVLPQASHLSAIEQPAAFGQAVAGFVGKL